MRTQQFAVLTRRRLAGVTMLIGALVALAIFAASIDAQERPKVPHVFWGDDLTQYVGAQIKAFNQDGREVPHAGPGEGSVVVEFDGTWVFYVSPSDARTVKFRLIFGDEVRETDPLDVVEGRVVLAPGISITDFNVEDTLPVQIRARVYPSSEDPTIPFRSIEFNLSVDGQPEQLNDNPRERTIRPNHAGGRWYRSNSFDLGDGFRASIIACKDPSGGVRFGIRVDGRDDIIPRFNLLPGSRTSTNWAVSNEVEISRPGDDANPSQAGRGDTNCRFGKDN